MFKQFPTPGQTPTIIDEIPRPKPGIIKQVNSVTRTPLRKKMIPPFRPLFGDRGVERSTTRLQPTNREEAILMGFSNGGGVNKALEELRNRLR